MDNSCMTDAILRGHALYWDMLGEMRGNQNHKGALSFLSGDLHFAYDLVLEDGDYNLQVEQLIGRIAQKEIPDMLSILPTSAPAGLDVVDCFMRTGKFVPQFTSLGMAKELSAQRSLPKAEKKLNILRVHDETQLKMSGAILNAVFDYDLFSYSHYLDAFQMHNVHLYLAEYDGLPVGACLVIYGEDLMEVAWVGTLPGYRKKGIAGQMMVMAEQDAFYMGKKISVLTAFEGAIHAYERIGYEGACHLHVVRYVEEETSPQP